MPWRCTRRSESIAPNFLTSELVGGEWLASWPDHFSLTENYPRYWLNRRLDRPQSLSCICRESIPNRPACCTWLYRLSYPGHVPNTRLKSHCVSLFGVKGDQMKVKIGRIFSTHGDGKYNTQSTLAWRSIGICLIEDVGTKYMVGCKDI
jgi:hypothetical protein